MIFLMEAQGKEVLNLLEILRREGLLGVMEVEVEERYEEEEVRLI